MITFLDLHDYGRFGNRLFMIAGTIGIAIKHGYSYGFGQWEESCYFKNRLPDITRQFKRIPKTHYRKYTTRVPFDYQEVKIMDNTILWGFMQTEKYFSHCRDVIRGYFDLKEPANLPKIKNNSIAIHFRGTDYDGERFPRCSADYYFKALSKMPNGNVYVFSDEIETIKKMLNNPKFNYIQTGYYISDFYLMSKCDHFIISNSTYAWWAAWLGSNPGKIVIAPKIWFGPTMVHNLNDIYCEKWIVL